MRLLMICLVLSCVGCTLTEWKAVATDAVNDLPAAAVGVVENPTPSGVGLLVLTYLLGLISKSAARGFGKGAVAAKSGVAAVVTKLLGVFRK